MPTVADIVRRINARFSEGRASNNIEEAGVLLRTFEGQAGRHSAAWEPCAEDEFCSRASDRLAASILNPRMPHPWSYDAGGIIISPGLARLFCSYHGDGNNFGRFCKRPTEWLKMPVEYEADGRCVPGCTSRFGWCDDLYQPCPLCEQVHCAWRASGLAKMIEAHESKLSRWREQGHSCAKGGHLGRSSCHNEVVLDAVQWTSQMPSTIEAFFYQRTSSAASVAQARREHAAFLQRYHLGDERVPLVVYDRGARDPLAPFELDAGGDATA